VLRVGFSALAGGFGGCRGRGTVLRVPPLPEGMTLPAELPQPGEAEPGGDSTAASFQFLARISLIWRQLASRLPCAERCVSAPRFPEPGLEGTFPPAPVPVCAALLAGHGVSASPRAGASPARRGTAPRLCRAVTWWHRRAPERSACRASHPVCMSSCSLLALIAVDLIY